MSHSAHVRPASSAAPAEPSQADLNARPEAATGAMDAAASAPQDLAARLGSLAHAPGFLLRQAGMVMGERYRAELEGQGVALTPVQGAMIVMIDENPGLNQIELARLMRVEGATLSQSIARLIALGYVTRYRTPQDRRAYALYLSREGRALRGKLDEIMPAHQDVFLAGFSPEQRRLLLDMLLAIIEIGDRPERGED